MATYTETHTTQDIKKLEKTMKQLNRKLKKMQDERLANRKKKQ